MDHTQAGWTDALVMQYRHVMDHIQSEAGRRVAQLMHQHHKRRRAGRRVAGSGWSADSLSDASSVVRGRASRESMLMDQFCRTDVLMDHIQAGWTDALVLRYRHVMDHIQSEAGFWKAGGRKRVVGRQPF
jgi:hypothetical protein